MNRPLTRKEWLASLDKAIKEFDWESAYNDEQQAEPVGYLCENAVGHKYFRWKKPSGVYKPVPLYTSPPPLQPLTDDELKPICDEYRILFGDWVHDFARAIEAKLKEKNT